MPAVAAAPWYKHSWPWILIATLVASVSVSLGMVVIAVTHPDGLVVDNYYEAGKGISRSLDREHLAQRLALTARLQLDDVTGEVQLQLAGHSQPQTLALNLISPTQPERDVRLTLHRDSLGRYIGHLSQVVAGRRFVELLGEENGQAWRLFEEEKLVPDQPATLGDEPLQGAE